MIAGIISNRPPFGVGFFVRSACLTLLAKSLFLSRLTILVALCLDVGWSDVGWSLEQQFKPTDKARYIALDVRTNFPPMTVRPISTKGAMFVNPAAARGSRSI